MKRAVLATIILAACGPGGRDGNGDHPDAHTGGGGDGQVTLPQSRVYAHSGSKLYQVDTTTLAPVEVGTVVCGGDLSGGRRFGIYATVDVGATSGTPKNDYLARIDPTTWKATPIGTGTGFDNIFGLGFWDGTIYGFASTGTNTGKIIT